jgi:DNA polymerase III epsilon subunit-like protein
MSPLTILLLDTETNGLPKNRYAPVSDFSAFPAILQLSWGVYTVDGTTMSLVESRDIGLRLDPSIPWDTGAAKVHGLAEAEARTGTPARDALLDFAASLYTADVVVAHNLAFDKSVIRAAGYAEASRSSDPGEAAQLRAVWPPGIKEFCTLKGTTELVKLPATPAQAKYKDLGPYKSPKLNELYAWLYGHAYDVSGSVLHTAKSDTHCLAQCVTELIRRGLLVVAKGGLLALAAHAE